MGFNHYMKKSIAKMFMLLASTVSVFSIVGCSHNTPPKFGLATKDITSPVEVATNKSGDVEVSFRLSDSKADELLKFAQKYSDAPQEEILVGSQALMKPGMHSEISISNGEIQVSYPASESDYAQAVAASLSKR